MTLCGGPLAAEPPNLLLILADDMTPAMLGWMPRTRELVAQRGTSFSRAFPNINFCSPSRATLLTGKYAQNTGVVSNKQAPARFAPHEPSTVAAILAAGGYRTGLFGKYLNNYTNGAHRPPGWGRWFAIVGDSRVRVDPTISDNGIVATRPGHTTEILAAEAGRFIADPDPRPFFVYLAPPEPHQPHIVPERHLGLFPTETAPRTPAFNEPKVNDKPKHLRFPLLTTEAIAAIDERWRGALRSVQLVDEAVGRLVTAAPGNTVVVFLSDNGYYYGEHRIPLEKQHLYDAGLRVPLLLAGPRIAAGQARSELVSNADIAPTLLELAGIAPPPDMDGRSLVPLLAGGSPAWRYSLPLARHVPTPVGYGIRSRNFSFVRYANGEAELYDFGRGPYQLQSVVNDPAYQQRKAALRARADALRACAGATCRELEDQPVP
jgi:N-acetylglucosamine-6-sulfatase